MDFLYTGSSPRYLKGYGGLIQPNDTVSLTPLQILEIERGGRTRMDQDANFTLVGGGGGGSTNHILTSDPTGGIGVAGDTAWNSTNGTFWVKDASGWNLH